MISLRQQPTLPLALNFSAPVTLNSSASVPKNQVFLARLRTSSSADCILETKRILRGRCYESIPPPANWGINIVERDHAFVVTRHGKYVKTLQSGIHLLNPFVDKIVAVQYLREQVIVMPMEVVLGDDLVAMVYFKLFIKVVDPILASFGYPFVVLYKDRELCLDSVSALIKLVETAFPPRSMFEKMIFNPLYDELRMLCDHHSHYGFRGFVELEILEYFEKFADKVSTYVSIDEDDEINKIAAAGGVKCLQFELCYTYLMRRNSKLRITKWKQLMVILDVLISLFLLNLPRVARIMHEQFLDKVNSKAVNNEIVQATYENYKVLLGSGLIKSSSEEWSLLKNLGSWLGKLTISRNQVLRAREIDPKSLIKKAYENGWMIAVIPFTCKLSTPIPNIGTHVIINKKLSALGLALVVNSLLTRYRVVPIAMDRVIKEIVSGIVQRSISIATQTTKDLVLKDHAMESDETWIYNAAHLMVAGLAGSLAHVTCKGLNVASDLLEQALQLVTNDNLDLGCAVIEQAATDKVIYSDEERKFNKDITVGLIPRAATEFAISLLQILVTDESRVVSEFHNLVDALAKLAAKPGSSESSQQLVDMIRNPSANVAIFFWCNSWKAPDHLMANKEENSNVETQEPDPAGFREQLREHEQLQEEKKELQSEAFLRILPLPLWTSCLPGAMV
ncbi:hypothetical protein SLEP1_g2721 [Rubroshorea leprosula]|uniref:Uncharacterized protein n=1 Tax=Rubroshorea leprosula TaxID=152421 RepID=A0AAV5HNW1_9ROSI|nr:hypothetical protein SLEP1_g2721 [Rubroshorea leprosula]